MKNLHKKVGAIALSALIISGGLAFDAFDIHIVEASAKASNSKNNKINKLISNPNDIKKYKQNLYGIDLPDSIFARKIGHISLFNNDDDVQVKRLMEEIEDVCKYDGENIYVVKLSSEYDDIGYNSSGLEKHGLNAFLDGLQEILGDKFNGDKAFFSGAQLFFDDVDDFKAYVMSKSDEFESGYVRIQIKNVEGIFRLRSGKPESGKKYK